MFSIHIHSDLFRLFILQGVIALLACPDLHHILHVVDEDLSIAESAGV